MKTWRRNTAKNQGTHLLMPAMTDQLKALLYYYTVQGTVLEDLKCLVFYVFMYYFCERHYKPIIVWYY